jgi:hypothetical protein
MPDMMGLDEGELGHITLTLTSWVQLISVGCSICLKIDIAFDEMKSHEIRA